MAGLIDVGILKPELGGAFGAGYRQAEEQRNLLAQQRQQLEMSQMKLDQLRQDRAMLTDLQTKLAAAGHSTDPNDFFKALIQSGNPDYMSKGYEGLQRYQELQRAEKLLGGNLGGAPVTAPGAPVAPSAPSIMRQPTAAPMIPNGPQATPDMLAGTPYAINALAPQEVISRNALATAAPAAAAPAAATGAPANVVASILEPQKILNKINELTNFVTTVRDPALATRIHQQIQTLERQLELAGRMRESKATPDIETMRALGYPLTEEGYVAFRNAQRQERLLTPEEEAQKIRVARAAHQPSAPTITQIVDPTDPNKMITIDARRYQGGGAGAPGVIGVAGKEPTAALRTNKIEEGKTQLQNDLDTLRSAFTELDRLRAIPSTGRGAISNLISATQATGVGQALGRAGGTKEQVERDVINSARQRLVASIKNATGMSSKALDSNMELQTMLRSISDPGQSVEAAMRIIGDIEDTYVKGKGTQKVDPLGIRGKP